MPFAAAVHTSLGCASRAFSVFLAIVGVANVLWTNKLTATASGAVDAVAGRKLYKFLVPILFEILVKEALNVFEGDIVCGAAFGWHVLGISDGEFKASLEA